MLGLWVDLGDEMEENGWLERAWFLRKKKGEGCRIQREKEEKFAGEFSLDFSSLSRMAKGNGGGAEDRLLSGRTKLPGALKILNPSSAGTAADWRMPAR